MGMNVLRFHLLPQCQCRLQPLGLVRKAINSAKRVVAGAMAGSKSWRSSTALSMYFMCPSPSIGTPDPLGDRAEAPQVHVPLIERAHGP
jgi:hypothetical protein